MTCLAGGLLSALLCTVLAGPAVAAPPAGQGASAPAAATASDADAEFLRQAAQDGLAELEGARLALEKSRAPDVRAYAERMQKLHGAAQQRLEALARRKGVELQEGLSLRQTAQMKLLGATDGTNFDRAFARQVAIGAHEHALMSYQRAAGDADDAQVRAYAEERLKPLRALLDDGRALERSTGMADRDAQGGPSR